MKVIWNEILKEEMAKPYFKKLGNYVKDEYKSKICYPKYEDIFAALKFVGYDDVKVVILGQDPYHGENEAHGLSFSVHNNVKRPPSLLNILKELHSDLGVQKNDNDLSSWAMSGVLLLNSILTVVKDSPLSHKDKGWETFTDFIISKLNEREKPIVFVFWGSYARSKKILIKNKNHKIIESVHPSPLSAHRGFFGSKPFSKINEYLVSFGLEPIDFSK